MQKTKSWHENFSGDSISLIACLTLTTHLCISLLQWDWVLLSFCAPYFFKNKTRKLLRVIAALLLLVSAIFWVQAERFEATVSEKLQRGG
jgi:predicted membrane protein